jgi:acyl-coenzyme A thioesterase PaaI-like protein
MQLQFTGVPCTGTLRAQAGSHGFIEGAAGRQALSRVMITGDQGLVCMGMGTFMVLDMPPGMRTLPPLFGHPRASYDAAPDPGLVLEADEAPILARARKALRGLDGTQAFSEMLWDFRARKTATGASGTVANGPHIGNRVGHVQGGLTVAFAQATANAALSGDWMFNGITAGYVRPGEGARLTARATLVHQGRSTAVVRVEVFGQDKRRVLEATTTHSLRGK